MWIICGAGIIALKLSNMKKSILFCVTCFAIHSGMQAQTITDSSDFKQEIARNSVTYDMPVPPPPPPPLPPVPPIPPVPPAPPELPEISRTEIINSNGYEISIQMLHGKETVVARKNGKTLYIKLSTWKADPKYYEKKYGQLPTPPPIPQIPPVEI